MWLIAAFDLPSADSADAKRYRRLKKTLNACGFSPAQKSVAWRWCESCEFGNSVIGRVRKELPEKGDIMFFSIPDSSFKAAIHISDGSEVSLPEPFEPWLVFS